MPTGLRSCTHTWKRSTSPTCITTLQPHRCVYGCGYLLVCGMFHGCQSWKPQYNRTGAYMVVDVCWFVVCFMAASLENHDTTAQVRIWLWTSVGLWYVSWLPVFKTTIRTSMCLSCTTTSHPDANVYHCYIMCISCVCHVYILCISCVYHEYILCISCVCHEYILCMSGTGWQLNGWALFFRSCSSPYVCKSRCAARSGQTGNVVWRANSGCQNWCTQSGLHPSFSPTWNESQVGLARIIHKLCDHDIFCRDSFKYRVIYGVHVRRTYTVLAISSNIGSYTACTYGVHIRFWPILQI